MKVKITLCPNHNARVIHTTHRFQTEYANSPSELVSRLLAIDGVENVRTHNFEVAIYKGEMFAWEPIIEQALAVLNLIISPEEEIELCQ